MSSYDAVGNLKQYTDNSGNGPIMGTWSFTYDTLNRLSGAADNEPGNPNTSYCWSYDGFGNRLQQAGSDAAFTNAVGAAACTPAGGASFSNDWATYNANNQITGTPTGAPTYDPSGAGYILADSANAYLYDAEGRVCAVQSGGNGGPATGYVYDGVPVDRSSSTGRDADGNRVAKGSLTHFTCDMNPADTYNPATNTCPSPKFHPGPQSACLMDSGAGQGKIFGLERRLQSPRASRRVSREGLADAALPTAILEFC
jgi:YD repeat-containing protein